MTEPGSGEPPILNVVGDLVALGPLRRNLLPVYHRWISDFATLRTLAMAPRPMTMEQEQSWYDRAAASGSDTVYFTIYERATLRPIGNTELHHIDHRNRSAALGILIGEPDARGKGYGTEAVRLVLDYAFVALGLHNVMLTVYEFNLAGRRAYEKAGFREIGRRRQARLMGSRLWDEIYLDCLATEWESPVLAKVFVPDQPRS